jgi:DNA-binding LytR/AlgR family response regulator
MSGLKIGIIEDELIIAETIRETLLDLGYEPTEAAINFSQGLELIEAENPDLLLMDIVLSGSKDGIDLAHEIRKLYHIPIIFLTSNADEATINRAKEVQPDGYLVKPFNRQDLYTSIEIAISNFERVSDHDQAKESKEVSGKVFTDAIFIKQDTLYHKVRFADIIYLQSDHVYVEIYTLNQKFLVRSSLGNYLEKLPENTFFQIQRGCAINISYLETINHSYAIVAGKQLPVGKTFRDELMKILNIG